ANATPCNDEETHKQISRRVSDQRALDAGSVGLAFRKTETVGSPRRPRAKFAIISVDDGAIDVSLRAMPFDIDQMFDAARRVDRPALERWLAAWTPKGAI